MIVIPSVLDQAEVAHVRQQMTQADWQDGNATSGVQSAMAKRNLQLPEGSEAARTLGALVLDALGRNPTFIAAALPLKVFPPLFNRYEGAVNSAVTSTMPSASSAAAISASAATCPLRCFWQSRIPTRAGSW